MNFALGLGNTMSIPEIEFDLHDSNILNARFIEPGRLELDILLYEIFYPGKLHIQLILSGIQNITKVKRFYEELVSEPVEDGGLWFRIDGFSYDTKVQSTKNDLYFYFEVASVQPIRIHCKKINFLQLEKTT